MMILLTNFKMVLNMEITLMQPDFLDPILPFITKITPLLLSLKKQQNQFRFLTGETQLLKLPTSSQTRELILLESLAELITISTTLKLERVLYKIYMQNYPSIHGAFTTPMKQVIFRHLMRQEVIKIKLSNQR